MNEPDVWVIFGPTGSGKTQTAIELAKRIDGEIINLDSMQVYREIAIGTAKPTPQEMAQVPHHLYDIVSVADDFTVADYQKLARHTIDDIRSRGKRPILVGGTGLYLSSLYYQFEFRPETERSATAEVTPDDVSRWQEQIDVKNPRRLHRAVLTGQAHDKTQRVRSDLSFLIVWLDWPREQLHHRIEQRTDQMMEQGLLDEVRNLRDKFNLSDTSSAAKGIGYKELSSYLNGEADLTEAIERIKIHTRQYAKRQMTWVRHQYEQVHRLDATLGVDHLVNEIQRLGGVLNEE